MFDLGCLEFLGLKMFDLGCLEFLGLKMFDLGCLEFLGLKMFDLGCLEFLGLKMFDFGCLTFWGFGYFTLLIGPHNSTYNWFTRPTFVSVLLIGRILGVIGKMVGKPLGWGPLHNQAHIHLALWVYGCFQKQGYPKMDGL